MNDKEFEEELYQIIENQIADGDPKETRETLDKLVVMGMDRAAAKQLIGKCLAIELLDVIENGKTYNHRRYVQNLKGLPMEPSED